MMICSDEDDLTVKQFIKLTLLFGINSNLFIGNMKELLLDSTAWFRNFVDSLLRMSFT